VIHTAAQPSHDWAAQDPHTDFGVNATGTLNLLEAHRHTVPDATFIFMSTNKVYGDRPNMLPLIETETRWTIDPSHPYARGIPEEMSIDASTHSVFGASKVAADIMVQEYGRYFGMKTVCFRGGCLTGPGHSGAELHGFLAYLMKCCIIGRPYRVLGYKAKQVRDKVAQGTPFADAAKGLGADDVATTDINPVVAPLPAAVLDAVGQVAPGAVSDPIPSGPAWLVVRVERRQDVPRLTLDELRPELTDFLAERERHEKFQEWFQQKFTAAKVKVDSHYGKWDPESTVVD